MGVIISKWFLLDLYLNACKTRRHKRETSHDTNLIEGINKVRGRFDVLLKKTDRTCFFFFLSLFHMWVFCFSDTVSHLYLLGDRIQL